MLTKAWGGCKATVAWVSNRVVPTDSSTVFTPVYDQMSQEPSLLTITLFLLHVLNIDAPSPVLDVQAVASSECFSHSRPLLAHALANASEFSLLCEPHGMYQVDERYNGPTLKRTPFFAVPGKVLSGGEARTYPKKPDGRRVLLRASSKLTRMEAYLGEKLSLFHAAFGCYKKLS